MLTVEVSGEIYRLFTEEPEGGLRYEANELRRSVDPIEELHLLREWATSRLAAAAVEESDVVVELIEGIYDQKPFNAFGLGINIVRQLRLTGHEAPAEYITSTLTRILDDDAELADSERLFTDFDRLWLEGRDLDFLDEDSMVLCLIWEVFDKHNVYKRTPLFRSDSSQSRGRGQVSSDINSQRASEMSRIQILSRYPRNITNDVNYDKELLRLVLGFEKLYGFVEVMRLVDRYPARSEEITYKVNLVVDRSMHAYARKKLEVACGGSVEAALSFINAIRPRTELGAKLMEAFQARITKNRSS